jgi:hypothetical protein
MKKVFIYLMVFGACQWGNAQDSESSVEISAGFDVVSSYVWRGLEFDDSPNIQPFASAGIKGFTIMYWGSYAPWNDYSESDIYLSYSFKSFTLSLNDYYSKMGSYGYTNFKKNQTDHAIEASLSYEALSDKFPLNFTLGTFVYGADYNENGDQNYSTYFEIEKPFSVSKYDFSAFLGTSLTDGYYAEGFALVNLGLKASRTFSLNDAWTVPISLSAISNPDSGDFYFVAGVGLYFAR